LHLPIFITGFMGAGKTRVGRLLARRLGRIFIDTDERVEARAGKSIARIFAEEGEDPSDPWRKSASRMPPRVRRWWWPWAAELWRRPRISPW